MPLIRKYFFHQRIVYFVNKLELSGQKYKTNGNVRGENYNGKFFFPVKDSVSFNTDRQPIYFMSTRFLKDKINIVHNSQFKLA